MTDTRVALSLHPFCVLQVVDLRPDGKALRVRRVGHDITLGDPARLHSGQVAISFRCLNPVCIIADRVTIVQSFILLQVLIAFRTASPLRTSTEQLIGIAHRNSSSG